MKKFSDSLYQPNPGLCARLSISVLPSTQVIARLTFTNLSAQPLLLFKPLLGQGTWEEIFYVMTKSDKQNLAYQGIPSERSQSPSDRKVVLTGEESEDQFLKLNAGEVVVIEKKFERCLRFKK